MNNTYLRFPTILVVCMKLFRQSPMSMYGVPSVVETQSGGAGSGVDSGVETERRDVVGFG